MIDFTAGCFGAHDGAAIVGGGGRRRAVKNTVTCFYVTSLSAKKKEVLIMVTWQRSNGDDTSVVVVVDDEPSAATPFRHAGCNTQILWKKGSRSFFSGDSMFLLHWDISAAKYGPAGSSSEPTKDFYLSVAADAELVLLLGDKGKDYVDKFPMAPFSMYGRCERVVVPASAAVHYSTKARFRDGGREHDVSVVCRGERDAKNGELCVSVDRKRAIHVPNVGWNFRGNQAITIDDGLAVVDVLWDVHDWWFRESSGGGGGGGATFLFRARSSPESERACWWPEEAPATATPPPFTLSIQVSKSQ